MSNRFASQISKSSMAEDASLLLWDHSSMDVSAPHGSGSSVGIRECSFDEEALLDARPLIEDDYQLRAE